MVLPDVNLLVYAFRSDTVEHGAARAWLDSELCRVTGAAGNQIPDVHLAAIAIEHGAELASHDRGFARFPGLRHNDPL